MRRKPISEILARGEKDQPVEVCGWVRSKRVSKNCAFIAINDGSCQDALQLVVANEGAGASELKDVQTGAAIKAFGRLIESPAKGQAWEVAVDSLEVVGESDSTVYPLQKKGHSLEFLREIAHLRPRTNTFGAVFRVRNCLAQAVHRFFSERGFVWAHTPILTASDCEGAGELFRVTHFDLNKVPRGKDGQVDNSQDFFGKPVHLTVSGQLQAEFLALALGNVYTFGPTFRAENSNTTRHLAEFWMIEPEIAFADLEDNMTLAEDFVHYMIADVLEKCPEELAFFESMYKNTSVQELERLAKAPFKRLSYSDAIKILTESKQSFTFPVSWGVDLQTEHERYLTDQVFKGPVIVYDYPKDIKAFYMRLNDDGKTVAAMDVLVPGVGEMIGGSQREERLGLLEERMSAMGIPQADLQWYTDLRRYGSVPHAGFGLGFERLIMYVTGMQNIRDVILCPRSPQSIAF